uniref:Uncharacterized protein n=1 Tax=Arundo donax TaxID=35708 RepID=A0A0A9E3N6_ARUDO
MLIHLFSHTQKKTIFFNAYISLTTKIFQKEDISLKCKCKTTTCKHP